MFGAKISSEIKISKCIIEETLNSSYQTIGRAVKRYFALQFSVD